MPTIRIHRTRGALVVHAVRASCGPAVGIGDALDAGIDSGNAVARNCLANAAGGVSTIGVFGTFNAVGTDTGLARGQSRNFVAVGVDCTGAALVVGTARGGSATCSAVGVLEALDAHSRSDLAKPLI